jgi:hypothetical protein
MNKDLQLFTKVINRLIYLTTKDEYGSSRSRGVETLSDLAEELNTEGIHASKGMWTENSLKLHLHRVKLRYTSEQLTSECDFDMIDRCAWEYSSGTPHEEIVHKRKSHFRRHNGKVTQSYPVTSYEKIDGEKWKECELTEVINEDKRILRVIKNNRNSGHLNQGLHHK